MEEKYKLLSPVRWDKMGIKKKCHISRTVKHLQPIVACLNEIF